MRWIRLLLLTLLCLVPTSSGKAQPGASAPGRWTALMYPPVLEPMIEPGTGPEELEGQLDASLAATVQDPRRLETWTRTVILQLMLDQPQRALRTLRRARGVGQWTLAQEARLVFLEAAASIAREPRESDPLDGEKLLEEAARALRGILEVDSMRCSARYGLAMIECAWGRPGPARALLDSLPDLPPADRRRLWKEMVRASSSGMDTWKPHFQAARDRGLAWEMRTAAHLAPGPYLLTFQKHLDGPIEAGLSQGRGGMAVDFREVESLMEEIPWDPPDFYRGVRRRIETIRSLDAARGQRALELVRAQHRFDRFFSEEGREWKERCARAVAFSEGKAEASEALGLWYLAGRWHWGRGFALGEMGRTREQLAEYEAAVRCAEELGDPAYLSSCIYNLSALYAVAGERARRLHLLPSLVELAERYGISTAPVALAQAGSYADRGDFDRAFAAAAQAYRESRRRGDRYLESTALTLLAWNALYRDDPEQAERFARAFLDRVETDFLPGLPPSYHQSVVSEKVWSMIVRGRALPVGDPRRAEWLDRARAAAQGPGQHQQQLYCLLAEAEDGLATGEFAKVRRALEAAEALGTRQELDYELWRVETLQGRTLEAQGRWKEAAGRYESALFRLESQSAELDQAQARAEFLLPASELFDRYIALLAGPLRDPAAAYAVDERDRAHALLLRLGEEASGGSHRERGGGGPGRSESPGTGSVPGDILRRVQETLDPEDLLLQYRVCRKRIDLWLVSASDLRYLSLPADGRELEERVDAWRRAIEGGWPSPLAEELAALLLDPAEPELSAARHVIVVAGATLSRVPFVLLRREGRPLLEDHVVSHEISGAIRVLLSVRPTLPPTASLLAVGYDGSVTPPGLRLRPLPLAEREATVVASLSSRGSTLRGDEATAERVRADLEGAAILHIASHSGLDDFGEPYILLAPEDGRPGLVRAEDLASWPLQNVTLVTLAGCESSQLGARNVQGDLSTLGAAIFSGGSRDLIASLWRVGDRSTLEMMRSFYGSYLTDGMTAAEALRTAQLKMAHGETALERDWGAFRAYGP